MNTNTEEPVCNAVIGVVHNAYYSNVLHNAHREIGEAYRNDDTIEPKNLKEAFLALGKVPHAMNQTTGQPGWGRILGFNSREVVNQIAFQVIRRATKSTEFLLGLAKRLMQENGGRVPIKEIAEYKDNFILGDVEMTKIILDVKGVWLSPKTLQGFQGALEEFTGLMGFNHSIDQLCRRLRAITKPHAKPATPKPVLDEEQTAARIQTEATLAGEIRGAVESDQNQVQVDQHRADALRRSVEKADAKTELILNEQKPNPAEATTRIILNDQAAAELSASIPKEVVDQEEGAQ
mgnify:CR=1 FL=1